MIRLILTFYFLLTSLAFAGDTTTNGFFYLPSQGASGSAERTAWFNSLQATDGVLGLMRSGNYWTDGANSTLTGEVDLESADLVVTGSWSFADGKLRAPQGTALVTADCDAAAEAGRMFIDTDANTGQQLYVCEGLTGWVLSSGSGSNVSGFTDDGANIRLTTSTDNVGIGTLFPEEALKVVGSAKASTSVISPKIVGGSATTQSLTYQTTSGVGATGADHIFKVGNAGGTEAVRILNSGNVGVGTPNPSKPLEVITTTSNGIRLLYTGASSATTDARIAVGNNDGAAIANGEKMGSFVYEANDGTGVFEGGALVAKADGTWTNTSHPTAVYVDTTAAGSTTRTERWRIDNVGRMGLGTTNPLSTATIIKRGAENVLSVSSAATQLSDFLVVTSAGNVGIGSALPQALLQVKGGDAWVGTGTFNNSTSNPDIYVQGNLEVDGYLFGDGSQLTGIAGGGGGWADGGTNIYQTLTTDLVGIGTTSPSTTLEIVKQASSAPLMVSSAATGDGDFLIVKSDGNVGIGSITPGADLDVIGTGRFSSLVGLGTTRGVLQLTEASANGSNYVALVPGNSLSADTTFVLPTADGTTGQAIITDGAGNLSFGSVASSAGWTDGGTNVYVGTTTDNVGIGTTTPSTTLEIVKVSNQAPFMISSTATGDGNFMIVTSSGNVGIGTVTASNALVVNGAVQSLSTASTVFAPTDSPTACTAGIEGGLYYDNSLNEFCDCNGSAWEQIDGGGGC